MIRLDRSPILDSLCSSVHTNSVWLFVCSLLIYLMQKLGTSSAFSSYAQIFVVHFVLPSKSTKYFKWFKVRKETVTHNTGSQSLSQFVLIGIQISPLILLLTEIFIFIYCPITNLLRLPEWKYSIKMLKGILSSILAYFFLTLLNFWMHCRY